MSNGTLRQTDVLLIMEDVYPYEPLRRWSLEFFQFWFSGETVRWGHQVICNEFVIIGGLLTKSDKLQTAMTDIGI